jgi:hypothetical protein
MTAHTPWWWNAAALLRLQASSDAASMATKICAGARATSRDGRTSAVLARSAARATAAFDGGGGLGSAREVRAARGVTASTASSSRS